jgi:hypothetical protein
MNPMSLLVLPREVLQEMRVGRPPHRLPGMINDEAEPRGLVGRALHEFGREFWAAMLSPPQRGKAGSAS